MYLVGAGGQEQLLLKSDKNVFNVMKYDQTSIIGLRGRVGPYGGQEQLFLKSDENILNVMKYI